MMDEVIAKRLVRSAFNASLAVSHFIVVHHAVVAHLQPSERPCTTCSDESLDHKSLDQLMRRIELHIECSTVLIQAGEHAGASHLANELIRFLQQDVVVDDIGAACKTEH